MLEFPDKGKISWLLKKRELDVSFRMESEDPSRKRKGREFLLDDELVKRSETSSSGQKKRRFSEDSTNMNDNIEEGYHHHHMGLDLELNLSPSLINLNHHHDHDLSYYNKNYEEDKRKKKTAEKGSVLGLETRKSMKLVASDLDDDGCRRRSGGQGDNEEEEEMVARVCMKCHMLVMLCKVSPACPNCKFMHSPEDTSHSLLFTPKPTLLA